MDRAKPEENQIDPEAYKVIPYQPAFKGEIIKLQEHLWGEDLLQNKAYFEWKYEQNPYQAEPMIYLCTYRDRLVGTTSFIGAQWQVGDREISFPYGGDSVIHPDHRNQGLFKRLNEFSLADIRKRGYEFTVALSAAQVTFYSFLMMGWRSVGEITDHRYQAVDHQDVSIISVLKRSQLISKLYRGVRGILSRQTAREQSRVNVFGELDRMSRITGDNPPEHVSVSRDPKPAEMAGLVARNAYDGRIRQVRDQKYFTWRYDNPLSEYRFLFWEKDGLDGYLVLQTKLTPGYSAVSIVDWEFTNPQVQEDLLRAAVTWGKFHSISIWTVSMKNPGMELLTRYGFVPEEKAYTPGLLVKELTGAVPEEDWNLGDQVLTDISKWDLRAIYSDGY